MSCDSAICCQSPFVIDAQSSSVACNSVFSCKVESKTCTCNTMRVCRACSRLDERVNIFVSLPLEGDGTPANPLTVPIYMPFYQSGIQGNADYFGGRYVDSLSGFMPTTLTANVFRFIFPFSINEIVLNVYNYNETVLGDVSVQLLDNTDTPIPGVSTPADFSSPRSSGQASYVLNSVLPANSIFVVKVFSSVSVPAYLRLFLETKMI